MNLATALAEPVVRRVLDLALDKLDRNPGGFTSRALRINLDESTAPEIFRPASMDERELAWHALEVVQAAGLLKIDYRLHKRRGSREERQPFVGLIWSDANQDEVRNIYGRQRKTSYAEQWTSAAVSLSLPDDLLLKVGSAPVAIPGRPASEVLARLLEVRALADQPLMLREVSAKLFWGMSKILDNRAELVARILDQAECPFPEQPILLPCDVPEVPDRILFIENPTSFERLRKDRPDLRIAIANAHGFRSAAARLRWENGRTLFYSRESFRDPDAVPAFERLLANGDGSRMWFWGDLDYSGMAILKALRQTFPAIAAWQPGYEPMRAALLAGHGHSPAESGKSRQRDPGETGCHYADRVLLPAIRSTGSFVDQE